MFLFIVLALPLPPLRTGPAGQPGLAGPLTRRHRMYELHSRWFEYFHKIKTTPGQSAYITSLPRDSLDLLLAAFPFVNLGVESMYVTNKY